MQPVFRHGLLLWRLVLPAATAQRLLSAWWLTPQETGRLGLVASGAAQRFRDQQVADLPELRQLAPERPRPAPTRQPAAAARSHRAAA